jgi:hypothetical protein
MAKRDETHIYVGLVKLNRTTRERQAEHSVLYTRAFVMLLIFGRGQAGGRCMNTSRGIGVPIRRQVWITAKNGVIVALFEVTPAVV